MIIKQSFKPPAFNADSITFLLATSNVPIKYHQLLTTGTWEDVNIYWDCVLLDPSYLVFQLSILLKLFQSPLCPISCILLLFPSPDCQCMKYTTGTYDVETYWCLLKKYFDCDDHFKLFYPVSCIIIPSLLDWGGTHCPAHCTMRAQTSWGIFSFPRILQFHQDKPVIHYTCCCSASQNDKKQSAQLS